MKNANFFVKAVAIFLVLLAMPCILIASPETDQINDYLNKMNSYQQDILQIAENIKGKNLEIALDLNCIVKECYIELGHILNLQTIQMLVKNPEDSENIKPVIRLGLNQFSGKIDYLIKDVNLIIAHLDNKGIIATATEFRQDLRDLKKLFQTLN